MAVPCTPRLALADHCPPHIPPHPGVQVRTASCGGTACVNSFGDEQLAVDMLADKLLFEALRDSGCCKLACSEEVPEPLDLGGECQTGSQEPSRRRHACSQRYVVGSCPLQIASAKYPNLLPRYPRPLQA